MKLLERTKRLLKFKDDREFLADSFIDELHFQSRRVVFLVYVASFCWIPYISLDKELHPDQPLIVILRWLLVAVGALTFVLSHHSYFAHRQQYLITILGGYIIIAAGLVTGLSGCDPTYVSGYVLLLCLLCMPPVEKRISLSVLVTSLLLFCISSLYAGIDVTSVRVRYSLNDLMATVLIATTFIFILDRNRHQSWKNAKIIERESRRRVDEAEAENKAKSQFLATMSHEIRTPMNGVIGMTELLQTTKLEQQQRQYVDVISNSGKALLNIINDILDYSKIEAGKLELESVDLDLDKLCLDVTSVFGLTAEKKKLELIVSIKPGTPILIKSDPTRLRQILLNLLGNAFKFTNDGGVTLHVKPIPQQTNSSATLLKFEIKDTGIGMNDEQVTRLFSAFSQADSTTTREFGGTGLGLSISKSLAELMGGEIGVTSVPGEGSSFWFTIYCDIADVQFIKQHQLPASLLKGKKVLFVDDSTEFAHVVQEQAISWGMKANVAYYGDKALEIIRSASANNAPFDIVSLDMNMPGLSGMEISKIMQKDAKLRNIKRVLLTAMRVTPPKEELRQANIEVAMQKPASARVIKECFLSILDNQEVNEVENKKNHYSNIISGKNILVAEDNTVNQMVITNMLKKLGANCVVANDGALAVEQFKDASRRFDIVLMDFEMPNMDGCDATKAIREVERNESRTPTPILALTAHAMREHQELCEKAGMDGLLSKPLELDVLRSKLCEYLA